MTAPVLFSMNSSSSQLLDMLQALRLGQKKFPLLTSRLSIKKHYSTTQAFQTLTTYLCPTKNPKPCRHSRVKAMLQKTVL
jgi:hypothetical protein